MSTDMRAVEYLGSQQIELRRIPIPKPKAGELLVRVRSALTCGTDVKTYRRGHPKFPPPFVFGHEFGGDIVEVGEGVEHFTPGMRVTANVFAECGECFFCNHSQGNLCENLEYNFGAFAEYVIIPASIARVNTFEIPSLLSYAEAAVVEPLMTVVHGQGLLNIQPGESVAVIGAGGPISLMHIQMALLAGASTIIAIGHSDFRLETARQLGAHHILNAHKVDTLTTVQELTQGRGADVVIECAGTKLAWETAVDVVRRGGRVEWFGGLPSGTKVELDSTRLHYGAITLLNTHGGDSADARQAFQMLSDGRINARALLTGELPLEQVEIALKKMIAGEAIKMVINPDL
jgi:L-iditol 2-dehydrogenase